MKSKAKIRLESILISESGENGRERITDNLFNMLMHRFGVYHYQPRMWKRNYEENDRHFVFVSLAVHLCTLRLPIQQIGVVSLRERGIMWKFTRYVSVLVMFLVSVPLRSYLVKFYACRTISWDFLIKKKRNKKKLGYVPRYLSMQIDITFWCMTRGLFSNSFSVLIIFHFKTV